MSYNSLYLIIGFVIHGLLAFPGKLLQLKSGAKIYSENLAREEERTDSSFNSVDLLETSSAAYPQGN